MKTLFFACLLATCYQAFGLKELEKAVVSFNANGITGTITFSEVDDKTVRIVTDLQGLTGEQGWHVHGYPVDQTVDHNVQCLSSWVGGHYDPTNARANPNYDDDCGTDTPEGCEYGDLAGRLGFLPESGQLDETDSTGHIALRGLYSIVGRSVVIHERGTNRNFECGTIRSQRELDGADVTILQSVFVSPIAGTMFFKQVDGFPDVQIWGKLYYVDDSEATVDHNWHIHRDLPDETYRVGVCGPMFAGPHYNPTGADFGSDEYMAECRPDNPSACEVGDLTGKLGIVDVAATPADYADGAFFFTDTFLNLTGFQAVVGRSVVVHVPDRGADRLGCAPLVTAETITLESYSKDGAPLAKFSQFTPFQDTVVTLDYLPSLGVPPELGDDEGDLTIVTAAHNPIGACPLDGDVMFDSTYSPLEPVMNVDTPDGFDLGDLSGGYGDYVTSCGSFSAFDLPVFGAERTISGRTLRFTYGNRRVCGALLPQLDGEDTVMARASFGGRTIGGNVFFIQERSNDVETGSTFIIVDIYYIEDRDLTATHNWHVHMNPEPTDNETCTGDSIGGHYNPFSVSLDAGDDGEFSDYSVDCNGDSQLRCESGDMSGKHGQLKIASASAQDRPTYSYVDSNLELGGEYSILNRSIGLHLPGEGGALFDCATITVFVKSKMTIMSSVSEDDMSNRVTFAKQVSADITSPNDVLILNQYVSGGCLITSMKILGETQEQADAYAGMISDRVDDDFSSCMPSGDKADEEQGECPLDNGGGGGGGGGGEDGAHFTALSLPLLLLSLLVSSLLLPSFT